MRSRAHRLYLEITACIIIAALAGVSGCGGGGGAKPVAIDQELFTPNYISSLDSLLHWNHLPMTVSFQSPSNMLQLGWSSEMFNTAAQEWNQPGKQVLVKVVAYGAPADVVVRFVNRATFTGSSAATGIAHVSYYENTWAISTAEVEICKDDPYHGTLSSNDLQFTIAHEIGHALGIQGHSENSSDLMCRVFRGGQQYDASESDFNTIMTAYSGYFSSSIQSLHAVPNAGDRGPLRKISVE